MGIGLLIRGPLTRVQLTLRFYAERLASIPTDSLQGKSAIATVLADMSLGPKVMTKGENMTAIAPRNQADVMEQVVMEGDLSKLSSADRVFYYNRVCESLGLNPLTQPFAYIRLNSKLTLYAKRDCTDQLRKIHKIGVTIESRERQEDVYVVTARATEATGRTDESIGAVSIAGAKGEALANALMKAETKAKRRVTLSICGLGWMDETEISTIPDAQPVEAGELEHANGKESGDAPDEHIQGGITKKQYKEIGRLWNLALKDKLFADQEAMLLHLQEFKRTATGRGDLTEQEANRYIDALGLVVGV